MSTNCTPNFHLSQWEPEDKVLRTDFNADNAKIDAALFCHPSAERICSVEVEEETEQLEMDISQVDWSRYMALVLMIDSSQSNGFYISTSSGTERSVMIYRGSTTPGAANHLCSSPAASHMVMILPVFYDGDHTVSAISFGGGGIDGDFGLLSGGGGTHSLSQCRYIRLQRQKESFQSGDWAVLWGVK